MGTNFYWKKDSINKSEFANYFNAKVKQYINYFSNRHSINSWTDEDTEEYFYHIGKRSAAGLFCHDCHITTCEQGDAGIHSDTDVKDVCPVCGKSLGNKDMITSFSWFDFNRDAYLLDKFDSIDEKVIRDEYGEEYTVKEFRKATETPVNYMSHCLFS